MITPFTGTGARCGRRRTWASRPWTIKLPEIDGNFCRHRPPRRAASSIITPIQFSHAVSLVTDAGDREKEKHSVVCSGKWWSREVRPGFLSEKLGRLRRIQLTGLAPTTPTSSFRIFARAEVCPHTALGR